jgi:hypothetical protein
MQAPIARYGSGDQRMTDPHEVAVDASDDGAPAGASQASIKYIGQWRGLVSTTNWEKGKIIARWRQDLIDSDAPAAECSDEAWSQLVGDVTAQHVGRLRRVHERFANTWQSYEGLYWTHFLAALDWDDAEMWLEGALQNHWSVAKMRRQRWETLGSVAADEPLDAQIVAEEADLDPFLEAGTPSDLYIEDFENVAPIEVATPAHKDSGGQKQSKKKADDGTDVEPIIALPLGVTAEPLESLDDFPEDFVDAFEDFRHVILQHKKSGWQELTREDVLQSLESLRLVVLSD